MRKNRHANAKNQTALPVPKKKKKGAAVLKIVLLCVAVVALCFFAKTELDIYSQTAGYKEQLKELRQEQKDVSVSIAEKKELRDSILSGDASDEKILRIIRAKGYVYPDEVICYDVEQEG